MIELSQQEQQIWDTIQSKIRLNKNDQAIDAEVVGYLMKLPYTVLIALCTHSDKFNNFMHFNPVMLSTMEKQLKQAGYISSPIHSIDGKEKHDVFDHYLAALMMQDYFTQLRTVRQSTSVKKQCLQLLDHACQLGFYPALVIRCKQAMSQATVSNLSLIARKKIIQSMKKDMTHLTHLYWSIGYLQAGSLCQVVGDYFFNLSGEEEKNYGLTLHEECLKDFMCAFLLNKHLMSISIMNTLTQGKGLAALSYEGNAHIQTWNEFQTMIYNWVDGAYYKKISALAEKEIAHVLNSTPKKNKEEKGKKAA